MKAPSSGQATPGGCPVRSVTPGRRRVYVILAWCCVLLAALGVVLPLLPTTPFLLCALWLSLRGESELAEWLVRHPRFGPPIQRWQRERSIPLGSKRLVTALLLVNWLVLLALGTDTLVLLLSALLFCTLLVFIWRLPTASALESDPSIPGGQE
ncbi:YbaN family protein [uncultured Microbulbifer sp.]|uniref:YbaN family protein n=1 Tax=uncultured Microbulbifer sp. TaxID=348147 RepID=UPI0025D31FEC|nr:YbaN family protein [uncultured Microbulbifer sp.]